MNIHIKKSVYVFDEKIDCFESVLFLVNLTNNIYYETHQK